MAQVASSQQFPFVWEGTDKKGKRIKGKMLAVSEAAVKADPMMSMAHYQLGMANLNLGQIPQARESFEAYLKADANGPKAAEVKTFLQQLPK